MENNSKILDLNSIILIATLNINNLKHKSQETDRLNRQQDPTRGCPFPSNKSKSKTSKKRVAWENKFL